MLLLEIGVLWLLFSCWVMWLLFSWWVGGAAPLVLWVGAVIDLLAVLVRGCCFELLIVAFVDAGMVLGDG